MSFGCTKSEMEKRRQACIANINEDLKDEFKKPITKCEECPFFDECSAEGEEKWEEAIEQARQSNGRFGKLYLEEGDV